jgi:hypothetical protein
LRDGSTESRQSGSAWQFRKEVGSSVSSKARLGIRSDKAARNVIRCSNLAHPLEMLEAKSTPENAFNLFPISALDVGVGRRRDLAELLP